MKVLSEGLPESELWIVGDGPSLEEERAGRPFVGMAGKELDRLLEGVGLSRSLAYLTFVEERGIEGAVGKKEGRKLWGGKWITQEGIDAVMRLDRRVREGGAKVVVVMGNVALWALTGEWGLEMWRGSVLEVGGGRVVVPVLHPRELVARPELRGIVGHDLRRVAWLLEGGATGKKERDLRVAVEIGDAVLQLTGLLLKAAGKITIAVDIETRQLHMTCVGLAWSPKDSLCIPFVSEDGQHWWTEEEEVEVMWLLYRLLRHENVTVIGQNFHYDAQYMVRRWGWKPRKVKDTMTRAHVMASWERKGLAYLASKHCEDYRYWKNMRTDEKEGVTE